MPESQKHINLVESITRWIENNFSDVSQLIIMVDSSGSNAFQKPKKIGGYIPDVYANVCNETNKIIIGEAKTRYDLEREHTDKQISAFLQYCLISSDSIFILSVPWDIVVYAKSLIKFLKEKNNANEIETVILDEIYGLFS